MWVYADGIRHSFFSWHLFLTTTLFTFFAIPTSFPTFSTIPFSIQSVIVPLFLHSYHSFFLLWIYFLLHIYSKTTNIHHLQHHLQHAAYCAYNTPYNTYNTQQITYYTPQHACLLSAVCCKIHQWRIQWYCQLKYLLVSSEEVI